jgi:hypothetical protein
LVERAGRLKELGFPEDDHRMPTFTGYAARCGRAPGPSINQSINQSSRTHLISALTRGEAPAHPLNPVPVQSRSSRSRQNEEGVIQYWRAPHLTPPPSARRPLHTLSPVRFASSRLPRVCSPTALGRLGHTSGAPRKGLMMRRGWRGTITGGRVRAVPSRAGGRGC